MSDGLSASESSTVEVTRSYPIDRGGGWYELSDGHKVRGGDLAVRLQRKLEDAGKSPAYRPWSGYEQHKCPFKGCGYEVLENPRKPDPKSSYEMVLDHLLEDHSDGG